MNEREYKRVLPKYYLIKEQIKSEIEKGFFKAGEKLPPERVLMKTYNVSRLTLRYALDLLAREGYVEKKNGVGSFVRSSIERKGNLIIEKDNFKEVQEVRTVDIILPEIEYFFGKVVNGIEDVFSRNNYETRLRVVDNEMKRDKILSEISRGIIKYAILSSNNNYLTPFDVLKNKNIPIVMLGHKEEYMDFNFDTVSVDNQQEGLQVAKLLLEKGYKQIVFVSNWNVNKDAEFGRYKGVKEFLKRVNKKIFFSILSRDFKDKNNEVFIETLREKIRHIEKPFGIVAGNDIVARDVYRVVKEEGYKIPYDVGVISFDNTDISITLDPPLSSMDLCREQLGREAAKLIIERIVGEKIEATRKVIINSFLIERDSTKLI